MQIWTIDSEANSLTPDRFWCVVLKEYKKGNYVVFINDDYYHNYSWADLVGSSSKAFEFLKLSELKGWLANEYTRTDSKVRYVGHNNISYDFYWLSRVLDIDYYKYSADVRDTYVLSRLASPKRLGGHSIEAWGGRFGLQKQEIADEQWSNFDPVMITRCVIDTEIQELVYTRLREIELRGFSLQSIELEHEVERFISQQRRDGVFVSEEKVTSLYTETKFHADYLEREIQKAFPKKPRLIREYNPRVTKDGSFARNTTGPIDYDIVGGPYSLFEYQEFNLSSPGQVLDRLLELGWEPTTFSKKTGNPTVGKDAFDNLPEDAPKEAKLIGQYRMTRSRQNLAEQIIAARDKDGYVHGYIDILGTNTHRMSSNSPNLQNIPKTNEDKVTKESLSGLKGKWGWECRDVFCVSNPKRCIFVDTDASGIQLRGLAHYGKDSEYVRLVSDPLIDIHVVHADVLGCSRAVAKTFIYAFLMGAGAKKLISVLGGNDKEKGQALLDKFYERFPFLKEFKKVLDKEVERGYHIALDGRLIALDKQKPHKAMAVALQSFEAIIMKKAMVIYQDELNTRKIPFVQRLMVHDEFLAETLIEYKDVVGQTMANGIVTAGQIYNSLCPLDGKYKTGVTWAECH